MLFPYSLTSLVLMKGAAQRPQLQFPAGRVSKKGLAGVGDFLAVIQGTRVCCSADCLEVKADWREGDMGECQFLTQGLNPGNLEIEILIAMALLSVYLKALLCLEDDFPTAASFASSELWYIWLAFGKGWDESILFLERSLC